jgi:peptidyl-prolyl cis-trans isomerase C
MTKYFLAAILSISFLVTCGGKKTQTTTATTAGSNETILAKVNGEILTLDDLRYQFPKEYRDQLRGQDLNNAIDTWINAEILAQHGKELGYENDPAVKAVLRFRKNDIIARRLIEKEIGDKIIVPQSVVDSVYAAHKDDYKTDKDRLRASHILVATKDEADAIFNRLKKGDDFSKLAMDYSLDKQSAAKGGDIGLFDEDKIDPDFAMAAKKLKVGEYSQPVKTQYGYHLIKLTERQAAGASLDSIEVKTQISDSLLTAKQGEAFQSLLDNLKKNSKIERLSPPGLDLPAARDSV